MIRVISAFLLSLVLSVVLLYFYVVRTFKDLGIDMKINDVNLSLDRIELTSVRFDRYKSHNVSGFVEKITFIFPNFLVIDSGTIEIITEETEKVVERKDKDTGNILRKILRFLKPSINVKNLVLTVNSKSFHISDISATLIYPDIEGKIRGDYFCTELFQDCKIPIDVSLRYLNNWIDSLIDVEDSDIDIKYISNKNFFIRGNIKIDSSKLKNLSLPIYGDGLVLFQLYSSGNKKILGSIEIVSENIEIVYTSEEGEATDILRSPVRVVLDFSLDTESKKIDFNGNLYMADQRLAIYGLNENGKLSVNLFSPSIDLEKIGLKIVSLKGNGAIHSRLIADGKSLKVEGQVDSQNLNFEDFVFSERTTARLVFSDNVLSIEADVKNSNAFAKYTGSIHFADKTFITGRSEFKGDAEYILRFLGIEAQIKGPLRGDFNFYGDLSDEEQIFGKGLFYIEKPEVYGFRLKDSKQVELGVTAKLEGDYLAKITSSGLEGIIYPSFATFYISEEGLDLSKLSINKNKYFSKGNGAFDGVIRIVYGEGYKVKGVVDISDFSFYGRSFSVLSGNIYISDIEDSFSFRGILDNYYNLVLSLPVSADISNLYIEVSSDRLNITFKDNKLLTYGDVGEIINLGRGKDISDVFDKIFGKFSAQGKVENNEFSGDLEVHISSVSFKNIELQGSKLEISDLDVYGAYKDNIFKIDRASGHVAGAGAKFISTGFINLPEKKISLGLELTNFEYYIFGQGIPINGRIDISGTFSDPYILANLNVENTSLQLSSFSSSFGNLKTSLPKHNVFVNIDNLLVSSPFFSGLFSGKLSISGEKYYSSIEGELKVKSGEIAFIGRTFPITEGKITFDGDKVFVDISSESSVKSKKGETYTVKINVYGFSDNISIMLSSSPPLKEEQIVCLIVSGVGCDEPEIFKSSIESAAEVVLKKTVGGTVSSFTEEYIDVKTELTFSGIKTSRDMGNGISLLYSSEFSTGIQRAEVKYKILRDVDLSGTWNSEKFGLLSRALGIEGNLGINIGFSRRF